uniref:alcohol dehydrogenase (NADP(+)) n=2 Tax=Polytomella TaxID=3049 RepID=L0N917_9CHLO|nr:zinc-containing alcohol dehydrogenase family protein (ADH) [Polytomella parva]CBY84994.1 zinc-containing alcohol dehydrogenase family protein [Polytomella sp. Pringsheim 198.80]|eukprot:CAMPEP_0175049042 /NCGR_PEP_ID=MMETSP0052_2-20121109/6523_1 /TAXON_ID=51329 ORGANISM="Polytomella parva, Strain SAG 63-3" /NCGR_SAMPLE_ID=MMETSP0052_2 /ASSEMBLY_ACC=CAM_ASM_000194 /LENGTH=410 /DNA_ID=CAMNT_0016313169 /DNA_START=55 /DNA_END=1287 /DNA_ORIENTATION=+
MLASTVSTPRIAASKQNVKAFVPQAVAQSSTHGAFCHCSACFGLPVNAGSQRRATRSVRAQAGKTLQRRGMASLKKSDVLEKWSYSVPAELGPSEIDVRVTHNGLCHSDLHMALDDWGVTSYPFLPGHEVIGEVVAMGSMVKNLKIGDVVGAGWIRDSCRRCLHCLSGEENICEEGYTGSITFGNHGGFQDVMRFPADFVAKIPDSIKREHAAPLLCAGVTVFAPLKRHVNRFGMRVAIMGVGGLGHLAIQFARAMGCNVTAIDIHDDKAAEAKSLGAQNFVNYKDVIAGKVADVEKVDLIINAAAARVDHGKLIGLLKTDGKLVQIGIPGGNATITLPLQDIVFGQRALCGTIVGGRKDMTDMLDFAALHNIKPMIELFPLSKVNEAMEKMKKGLIRYRVVLTEDFKDW